MTDGDVVQPFVLRVNEGSSAADGESLSRPLALTYKYCGPTVRTTTDSSTESFFVWPVFAANGPNVNEFSWTHLH